MEKIIPVKILLYFTILVLSQLSSVKSVNANECIALNPSEGIEITTFSASVCINIRSLSTDNIYIFPDISQGISAEYLTTVKNTSGQTLFYNHISNNVVHSQLSTGSSNDVTVTLYPRTDGRKYIFTVNHQDIPEENQTLIYVGLTAWEFASTDNCGPTGCNGGGNALFAQGFDKNFMTMNSSGSEAQQCSNENRPPTDAPVHRKTKSKFKLNKTLRDARDWSRRVQLSGLPGPIQSSLLLHRALTTSKVGGPYDFSHADNTVFEGTQSYGNFFFAAHLRAMDVSPSIILRASSAYQYITDIGGFSEMIIPHDIKWAGICYVSQSCDDEVDAKWLLNGIKYVDEVFSQSGNDIDTDDSSCTDWEEANNDTASNTGPFGNTNGGGGSGGGSSTGGSSTGRIISVPSNTSSGEGWCFVQPPYAPYCWDA